MNTFAEGVYAYLTLSIVLFMALLFLDGSRDPMAMLELAGWSLVMAGVFLPIVLIIELIATASQRIANKPNNWRE